MAVADSTSFGMVNPAIFEHLQAKIDEDARVREELRNFLKDLEQQGELNANVSNSSCLPPGARKSYAVNTFAGTLNTSSTTYVCPSQSLCIY